MDAHQNIPEFVISILAYSHQLTSKNLKNLTIWEMSTTLEKQEIKNCSSLISDHYSFIRLINTTW